MMNSTTVTTIYLHLLTQADFRPAFSMQPDLLVLQAREPLPAFARFLYDAVGRDYYWIDRHTWPDDVWQDYLALPTVTLLVLYLRGTPIGYIELNAASTDGQTPGTEIVYYGLIPTFHGRGLGKHLLSVGVQAAFAAGATRVWLHTCTLDGPHALANYQARGFVPYRITHHTQVLPRSSGL